MRSLRSTLTAAVGGVALLAGSASVARADDRPLFVWTGTVDREAYIIMRGALLETRGDGFDGFRDARYRVTDALPREAGRLRVNVTNGRGDVDVIDQPTAMNGYTARIRVRDRQSGADVYKLVASWEGARGSIWRWDRDGDRDRRDRRDDRDDRYDRDARDGRDRNGRDGDVGGGFGKRRDAGALHFSARVDDVAEIRIRGRRVEFFARSGRPLYNVQYDVRGAGLPEYAIPLDVRRFAGRGNVTIIDYPRAWNNWTAVLRIDDSRSGADDYDIDLRW